jgi:hypothetical protein
MGIVRLSWRNGREQFGQVSELLRWKPGVHEELLSEMRLLQNQAAVPCEAEKGGMW